MRKILSILTARWFVTLIGVLLLAAILWFVGPLFAFADARPLESELVRVAVIAALLVIWAFAVAWSIVRSRNANARLVDDMAQQGTAPGEAAEEEIETIRGRLTEALGVLKNTRLGQKGGGRRWLYELPWYILIGPPGAGKTTALVNSGVDFPLADRTGQGRDAIRGIGGTRNCDWWFTNEAVLIDTAGRYTTQDSHAARDAAAWKGFLGLLKRNRPRQPINGALICVSISDLAIMPEAERSAHARAVRQRLQELTDELGVRFPVYVLFTKADLLAGFAEFFDDLDREAREQVWGISFAYDEGKGEQGAVAEFLKQFDRLIDRLNERVITRLHQEPDIRNRSLIYGFPAQVASLREPLHEFLTEAFRPSRYDARPLLRGAYLTSGTQEGTPFDRLMGAMAQSFGLDRQQMAPPQGRGRSYFLTDLLRRVVFAEAHIVSTNPRLERRLRWVRWGATTVALLVLAGGLSAWTLSYLGNRDLITSVQSGLNDYGAKLGDAVGPVRNADLAPVLPALDLLRAMPTGYGRRGDDVPMSMQFGLYQGDLLSQGTVPAYRRALNTLLLPRLVVRLEDILRGVKAPSNLAYVALKSYLMLGGRAPEIDRETILAWLRVDLNQRYPGADDAPHRQAILDHTAALLERPITVVGIDGRLVDQARRILGATPPAESAYRMLLADPAVAALPDWTIGANGGPEAGRVLARPSGKGLGEGIPGIYTYRGFHETVLAGLENMARMVASERWVVDSQAPPGDPDDATIAKIASDALQLYYNDYISAWNALLADVQIVPFQSQDHAIETLNILSGPSSPLAALLRGAAKQTDLAAPPPEPAAGTPAGLTDGQKAVAGMAADDAKAAAQRALGPAGRLATLLAEDYAKTRLGGGATAADAPHPGAYVSDRFRDLRGFVEGPNGGASPLDDMIRTMADIYRQMTRSAMAPGAGGAAANAELAALAQQLTASAGRAPEVMRGWANQISQATSEATIGGARRGLNADWNTTGRPLCQAALGGRYPFARGSRQDVKLDDFGRLFAPGALIDGFFTKNLAQYVDTSRSPWRWTKLNNVDLGISDATLAQFEKAARIRDAFFPQGGTQPSVGLEIQPMDLSANAANVLLDINGQILSYEHGPQQTLALRWPGAAANQARVSFTGDTGTPLGGITQDGPWALFRLIDQSRIGGASASDRFRFTVSAGGASATFEVRTGSVLNPFTLPQLRDFQCPQAF